MLVVKMLFYFAQILQRTKIRFDLLNIFALNALTCYFGMQRIPRTDGRDRETELLIQPGQAQIYA